MRHTPSVHRPIKSEKKKKKKENAKRGVYSCLELPQSRCSHLLSINIAGCYSNHCGLPYETSEEGSDPECGPVNPETHTKKEQIKF